MLRRTCHHINREQLQAEGRAGVFRSLNDEMRSLALAALRAGFQTPSLVASFIQGTCPCTEEQARQCLDELVRRKQAFETANEYSPRDL